MRTRRAPAGRREGKRRPAGTGLAAAGAGEASPSAPFVPSVSPAQAAPGFSREDGQ